MFELINFHPLTSYSLIRPRRHPEQAPRLATGREPSNRVLDSNQRHLPPVASRRLLSDGDYRVPHKRNLHGRWERRDVSGSPDTTIISRASAARVLILFTGPHTHRFPPAPSHSFRWRHGGGMSTRVHALELHTQISQFSRAAAHTPLRGTRWHSALRLRRWKRMLSVHLSVRLRS
ncbi:hypothetical protein CC85DRAFT_46537 [Cutaneotrichosporon oleaginosum]|uniref:Uncharacterized protein n=1 Tax=Cutaneotrichosporon oleaginosum TaxID=879819 RepID=A0A0J0XRE2_9TREE|nr:uncharacterized protein CC85DRAFT_46537 [Cutaneotrichosporon oleaginosum]KLT43658.1 hypothetical protein CC85DRAFT_46537 [Cutaneotrichosporon oleaginosum]TXT12676.1 hypothetical protein COLE_03086 [Cutaneotrichosporon oleaginosum]